MRRGYSKYGARKTEVDGITFDSMREAERYCELKMLLKAGKISGLILQPKFRLQEGFRVNGKTERAITYIGDFMYEENGHRVVEDVKGFETKEFRIKRKLFLYRNRDIELRIIS